VQWFKPINLATQEVEFWRIMAQGQQGHLNQWLGVNLSSQLHKKAKQEDCSPGCSDIKGDPISKITSAMVQVVECLHTKHKALSSTPRTPVFSLSMYIYTAMVCGHKPYSFS
jgi:hypothetical protein